MGHHVSKIRTKCIRYNILVAAAETSLALICTGVEGSIEMSEWDKSV